MMPLVLPDGHDSRQLTASVPATAMVEAITTPKMRLIVGSVVRISGRECIVERRLQQTWQFLTLDKEPLFFTDKELIQLQATGCFYLLHQPGTRDDISTPPSPLNIGAGANAENERRMAYVLACIGSPTFCRSRRVLKPIIADAFAKRREDHTNEKLPPFTCVLNWIDRYKKYGSVYGAAALADRNDRKGRRGERLAQFQLDAIDAGVKVWLARNTKANAYYTVLAEIARYEREGLVDPATLAPGLIDQHGRLVAPSLRTFERRCNQVGSLMANAMRIGLRHAKINGRTFGTSPLPERPYQEVEVDHCTLDILLRSKKKGGILLGRPNLIVFRDRATAAIVGWSLGYNYPSYAAFVLGLKRTMYGLEDDMLAKVTHPLPGPGHIENLITDNGKEFIGDDIKHAAAQLGINLIPLPPRMPWLKGQLEHWFRTTCQGLIYMLPGTTLENAIAKKDYETLGDATLTIEQFEALLARWICDEYNAKPSKTLGFIRGFNDGTTPLDAWKAKSRDYEIDPPPHQDVFIALAGLTKECTIQRNGITIDNIIYEGSALAIVMANPGYRPKGSKGKTTHLTVTRDPHNLGCAHFVDPFTGKVHPLDACVAHQEFASGLTLDEYQVILARTRDEMKEKKEKNRVAFMELVKIKAELNAFALKLSSAPSSKTVQRKVAAFLEGNRLRPQRGRVQSFDNDGTDYLQTDVATAIKPAQLRPVNDSATQSRQNGLHSDDTERLPSPEPTIDTDNDLDALRVEKNWG